MKSIFHHTPLPPVRNGIADYAARVNEALQTRTEVICVNENPFSIVPAGVEIVDPAQVNRLEHENSVSVYQIGNNPDHLDIFRQALRSPGIPIIHDIRLFYLHELMGLPAAKLEAVMRASNPIMARKRCDDVLRNDLKIGADYLCFDMLWDLLSRSRGIVVHSDFARALIRRSYGPEIAKRITVIPHFAMPPEAPDVDAVRGRFDLAPDTRLIVTSGFATQVKRFDWVAEAVSGLLQAGHRVHWVHAGAERREEFDLSGLIASDPLLRANTTITGFLGERELDDIIGTADIVVNLRFPSVGESSGTLARALAAARCCIVTKTAAYDSYPDNVVVKIPHFDPARHLFNAMEALLSSPEARFAFGAFAHRFSETHLSMDTYIDRLLQVCETADADPLSPDALLERRTNSDRLELGPFAAEEIGGDILAELVPDTFVVNSWHVRKMGDGKVGVDVTGLDARRTRNETS